MLNASMCSGAAAEISQPPELWEASFFEQAFRARGTEADRPITIRKCGRRNTERVPHQSPGDIYAMVAKTRAQRLEAAELVRQRYSWRGYVTESLAHDSLTDSRPSSTLIAVRSGTVVGTITLGFDGDDGLWLDHTYPEEIGEARRRGRNICELTRLAVTPHSDSRRVLSAMFGLAYRIGRVERGISDLYIEVNPRHAPVYRKLFGFAAASELRVCGRVKALAVLLHLDLERLDGRVAAYGGRSAADRADTSGPGIAQVLPQSDGSLEVAA